MAKVDLKALSEEGLTQQAATLQSTLDIKMRALKLAQDQANKARNALRAVQFEIEARKPVTLESMLVALLPSGENMIGYKWLQDRTWKGDWAGTGFGYDGSYWPETNQRCLRVTLNYTWDRAKLENLARVIEEALPAIKGGQIEAKRGDLKLTSKGASVALNDLKVLDIFDRGLSEHSDWKLAQMPDGNWVVFDSYNAKYSWGRARITGSLLDCLEEVRQYLWYDGGTRDEEDED